MKTVKKLTKETAKVETAPVKDTKTAVKNEAPKAAKQQRKRLLQERPGQPEGQLQQRKAQR